MRHILTYNEVITESSPLRLQKNVPPQQQIKFNKKCKNTNTNANACLFFAYDSDERAWIQQNKKPKLLKHSHQNEIKESRLITHANNEADPSGYYSHQSIFQPGGLMSVSYTHLTLPTIYSV